MEKSEKIVNLVKLVINQDYPFLEIEKILTYTLEKNVISGQFLEKSTKFVFNFTFNEDNSSPVLQRYF